MSSIVAELGSCQSNPCPYINYRQCPLWVDKSHRSILPLGWSGLQLLLPSQAPAFVRYTDHTAVPSCPTYPWKQISSRLLNKQPALLETNNCKCLSRKKPRSNGFLSTLLKHLPSKNHISDEKPTWKLKTDKLVLIQISTPKFGTMDLGHTHSISLCLQPRWLLISAHSRPGLVLGYFGFRHTLPRQQGQFPPSVPVIGCSFFL